MDGRLSEVFAGVAGKRLAAVECIGEGVSNQHELNAGRQVLELLGRNRVRFECRYLYFPDDDQDSVVEDCSTITFYDSREFDPTRSAEFRLTYPAGTEAMEYARAGDLCWVVKLNGDQPSLLILVAPPTSEVTVRLDRFFETELQPEVDSIPVTRQPFLVGTIQEGTNSGFDLRDADLLQMLGVEVQVANSTNIELLLDRFGNAPDMPSVRNFSAFTRALCGTANPRDDPDRAIVDWFELTNDLYFVLERHLLQPILDGHFANRESVDIDLFFSVAKSKMNSRFSRAGTAFECHLEALFDGVGLTYTSQSRKMPDGSKPDFLLPSRDAYDVEDDFNVNEFVTFLGAKTTLKERWRQLISEAPRVRVRHLATMDRNITGTTIETMRSKSVVPVLPEQYINDYYSAHASYVMNFADFISMARERQALAIGRE